jgi:hypothetical protein
MAQRPGHTLVELVVALGASLVLCVGLASALYVAAGANSHSGTTARTLKASQASFELGEELRYAIFVTERSEWTIEFAVADIDGDGQEDVIRYEWSGTPGDPLQRTFNHGTPEVVAEEIHAFELGYRYREKTETFEAGQQESSEIILAESVSGGTLSEYAVKSDQWLGQHFSPHLPAEATGWNVTRVELMLRKSGLTDGQFQLQLRPATGTGTPTSTVLEQVAVDESSLLADYHWESYPFGTVSGLVPSERLSLVLQHQKGSESCAAEYKTGVVGPAGRGLLESANQGASWQLTTGNELQFRVRGTYNTPGGTPPSVTRKYLIGVRMALQTGPDPEARIHTSVPLLNTPELLSGFWKADFDEDPTLADKNFDDAGDWGVRGGGSFDPASLAGGVWHADQILDTCPKNDFTQWTTVDVRFRNTSVGGKGAVFWLNYDYSGAYHAVVNAYLQLQADGTQTLRVNKKTDNSMEVPLVTLTGLSSDFANLRLVIDPGSDLVAVWVDRVFQGFYGNTPFLHANDDRFASILAWGSDAEFDYLCVRVSDNNP